MKITAQMLKDLSGFSVVDPRILGCAATEVDPDEKTELLWLRRFSGCCEPLSENVTIYQVVKEIRRRGYKPATTAQLLEFGKKPTADGQNGWKIIAPDANWLVHCDMSLCIVNSEPRKLVIEEFLRRQPHLGTDEFCYLVVKDGSKPTQ